MASSGGIDSLGLTPQEQHLWAHHLWNLQHMGVGGIRNPDGTISTVRQMVVTGPNGKFYNIPSIWNGFELPFEEAYSRAEKKGWDYWPSYSSPEEADARYMQMHKFMEQQ